MRRQFVHAMCSLYLAAYQMCMPCWFTKFPKNPDCPQGQEHHGMALWGLQMEGDMGILSQFCFGDVGGGEVPFSFLLSCWLSRLLVDHLSNAHVRRRRFTAQVSYKAERRGKQRTGRSVVWMVSLCCWEGEGRGQWAEREEVAGSSAVLGTYAFKGRVFWLLEGQIPKEGILRPPSCNSVTLPLPHIIPAPT